MFKKNRKEIAVGKKCKIDNVRQMGLWSWFYCFLDNLEHILFAALINAIFDMSMQCFCL